MTNQKPCLKVRLIKPDGQISFARDFMESVEAESRYERLVKACVKDRWIGARVQCLDQDGTIVRERLISQ
jgi:hypothetical protein